MLQRMSVPLIAGANAVCTAVSIAILYFAFRDWPARYASHTLSWSVVAFFLLFIATSVIGLIAAGLYARQKREVFLQVATVPGLLVGAGCVLGLAKAALTGDF